ncbi:MAG TPA: four helix bundle protein [Bacteroidales bacterium]|nr:four helix bundle protein [Bacteroidales bacterium]
MYIYSFEKLNVWQNSRKLSFEIYQITKTFPEEERFGLISQMRRAAVSISSNIAEGCSRISKKEQKHFYTISYSSAIELLNQIILSLDLMVINNEQYVEIRSSIEQITNQLNALNKTIS